MGVGQFLTFNMKLITNKMDEFLKTKQGLNYLQMKYPDSLVMDAVSEFKKRTVCPSINNK
jgi:hypothetical protein